VVTLIVSSEPDVSSILISDSTAGIAMPIRMITGMMVQVASSRALCSSFWSAIAPFDFRKRTIATIIAPKVTTAMITQIHSMSMCVL